ncbi:MAG TPA: hypothetical protein VLG66_00135 [Alphaproteobacteria bacterium]|nr:hypothetical protein [Alphaproteobacteria bacterium]
MTGLRRLWRGELPLADAFWSWAVLGGIALNGVTTFLFLMLISAGRPIEAFFIGYAISVPYNICVAVGVWRSAEAYAGDRRWATIARVVTCIGMALLSIT